MKINFWLIPGADTGNQKGFRILRDATQGNGARVLGPWPNESATALRENAPQGPFRIPQGSRKAGESFSRGAVLVLRDKVTFLHQFTLRSNFIRNPYIFPCYNQSI